MWLVASVYVMYLVKDLNMTLFTGTAGGRLPEV
jgi:hypothetical protein